MNETVATRSPFMSDEAADPSAGRRRLSNGALGYLVLTALVVVGWKLRNFNLVDPKEGLGYWLGIVGGSLMLSLLIYPLRKKLRFLQKLGSTRTWFQTHILLGLVGPLLILYHCNFQLGSFNSQVAFYSMLIVAGSGIVGRYFYAAIHRGLSGRKSNLDELRQDLAETSNGSQGIARLMPKLVERLHEKAQEIQGNQLTQSLGFARSLRWTFTHPFVRLSLMILASRELQAAALTSEIIARDRKRLQKNANRYIRDYTRRMGRVAHFSFYERLFAIWHLFHLPLFFVLVLSASFHVLAVHMY